MKIREIANQYGFNQIGFESFIRMDSTIKVKSGLVDSSIDDGDVSRAVELYQQYLEKRTVEENTKLAEKEELENRIRQNKDNMVLTTCPSVEGYTIVQQLGLVFGECLLKASLSDSIGAALDNFDASLSMKAKELSGTMRLMEQAREHTKEKMIVEAAGRGANAIVGIDCESSGGGDIMHISMFGTAVRIEKQNNR